MASDPLELPVPAYTPDHEAVFVPSYPTYQAVPFAPSRPAPRRWWLHILLFALTVATTTTFGIGHYLSFVSDFGARAVTLDRTAILEAFGYSAAILGILGAHEMGHYLACRYYGVDATLPFFLPFPSLSGTMGAVIKIRDPFPSRTALFDIGVAGPIAGFVVLIPLLFWGMSLSNVLRVPADMNGWTLGEPLLFKLATWLRFGAVPDGYSVNIHPVVFAAWFGMLATAWNLLPFGQLDGGHLTYATLGESSRYFSIATVIAAVAMCFVSYSWIVMTLMMIGMLVFLGSRHPRVMAEYEPLGPGRRAVGVFALVMLVLCFMPIPLQQI
jgi:membrane-associated protease RseP (regulator of RpoE activity)